MAIILRGKRKGESFKIGQFCNDWVIDYDSAKVYGIASVKFTDEELVMIMSSKNIGMLSNEFTLDFTTNTFKRKLDYKE